MKQTTKIVYGPDKAEQFMNLINDYGESCAKMQDSPEEFLIAMKRLKITKTTHYYEKNQEKTKTETVKLPVTNDDGLLSAYWYKERKVWMGPNNSYKRLANPYRFNGTGKVDDKIKQSP